MRYTQWVPLCILVGNALLAFNGCLEWEGACITTEQTIANSFRLEASVEKLESNNLYFEKSIKNIAQRSLSVSNSEFEDCDFSECDLSEAIFEHCKFLNCSFSRCNLSLIKIPHSRFFEVTFTDCKLVGVDWTRATWSTYSIASEINFTRCILMNSSFFGLTLNELKFDDCKIHEVDFREGNFSSSSMVASDFTNSLFMRTNLQNVDFTD